MVRDEHAVDGGRHPQQLAQIPVMPYRRAPGWAETWLAAGELGILEGLPEQSAANLDRAAGAAGDDPDLWRRLADANRGLGREDQASAAAERARQGG